MNSQAVSRRMRQAVLIIFMAWSVIMTTAFAGADHKRESARGNAVVSVENFGQVNDHIYRGGQPRSENYRQLAALGIKTIIDLRGDSEPGARLLAEGVGIRYLNLPMAPKHYPQPDVAKRFLEIVNDQTNWPLYVHCAGGRHRTGAMIAVYRISVDGWDLERTYQEMKDYDFYTSMGHGCYKDYVYDYYRDWQARRQTYSAVTATPSEKEARQKKLTSLLERSFKVIYSPVDADLRQ